MTKWFRTNMVVLIAIMALVATGTAFFVSQAQTNAEKEQTIAVQRGRISTLLKANGKLESQLDGLTNEYTRLYKQATSSGVKPSTVAPSTLPEVGATGAAGAAGRGIALALCTATGWRITYTDGTTENAGTCVGTTGKAGTPGVNGTDGTDGTDGSNGTDGATGAQGPPGPMGATGAAGAAGANGTGVSSVTCVTESDGSTAFRFTLTDGTTQDVSGACTATPTATPSP